MEVIAAGNYYITFCAHAVGFAAVSAGGALEHAPGFRDLPLMAGLAVLTSQVFLLAIFVAFGVYRRLSREKTSTDLEDVSARTLSVDMSMTVRTLAMHEAEDTIASIALAFLSLRALCSQMPFLKVSASKPPDGGCLFDVLGCTVLYGGAAASVAIALVLARLRSSRGKSMSPTAARALHIVLTADTLCCAWYLLWATELALGCMPFAVPDALTQRMIVAVLSSWICLCIFFVSQRACGSMKETLEQCTSGPLGLIMAWPWAQCIDLAVASITGSSIAARIIFTMAGVSGVAVACQRHLLVKLGPESLMDSASAGEEEEGTSKADSRLEQDRPLLQANSEPALSPRDAVILSVEGKPSEAKGAEEDFDNYIRTSVLGPTLQPAPKKKAVHDNTLARADDRTQSVPTPEEALRQWRQQRELNKKQDANTRSEPFTFRGQSRVN